MDYNITTAKRTLVDKTGVDTYNISADAERVTIAGKLMGDTLNIEGLSSDYMISAAGRTITLKSDEQTIRLQLKAGTGLANLAFLDGTITATRTDKATLLGTTKLGRKAIEINEEALNGDKTSASVFEGGGGGGGGASPLTLTTDTETVTGSSGNDTIRALIDGADDTLNVFDSIDGGDGTDTLSIARSDATVDSLITSDITSIEILSISAAAQAINLDVSDFDSIQTINLRTTGNNDITVTSDDATSITATSNDDDALNDITAVKATIISLVSTGDNDQANLVTADVLKTLSITGFAAGSSVSLDRDDADVDTTTLALNVTNSDLDFVDGDDDIEALTVKATGDVTLDLDLGAITSLTVTASGDTTINTGNNVETLESVTFAGAGDLTADLSDVDALAKVSAASATGDLVLTVDKAVTSLTTGSGADEVTLEGAAATTAKFDLGTGDDTITIDAGATTGAVIDGGKGIDRIIVDGTLASLLGTASAKAFKNFEEIGLGDNSTGTFDMSKTPGLTTIVVDGTLGGAVTFNKAAAGTALKFTDSADGLAQGVNYALATATGETDSLSITIGATDTTDIDLDGQTVTADDIESISIASLGKSSDSTHTIQLAADAMTKLTVTGGSEELAITYADTTLETIVASAYTGDLDLSAVTLSDDGATITTGKGDDTLETGNGDDVINAGAGDDSITILGTSSDDDLTLGAGEDTIVWDGGVAVDGTVTVNVSDFAFGEDGDVLSLDVSAFDAYNAGDDAVIITAAVAAALADIDDAAVSSNFIIADTSANLAALDISADTDDVYLVYETDTGNLYAVNDQAFTAASLIGSLGVGTLTADNVIFQA